MRPIKFRGRDLTGEMRFGHYVTDGGHPYIIEDHAWREVEPDSVAQFVGFDRDGNEVYEDDELVNDNGDGFFAELVGAVMTDEGFLHADIPPEILKLKEATK